jgi:hypothetical protein
VSVGPIPRLDRACVVEAERRLPTLLGGGGLANRDDGHRPERSCGVLRPLPVNRLGRIAMSGMKVTISHTIARSARPVKLPHQALTTRWRNMRITVSSACCARLAGQRGIWKIVDRTPSETSS